ncbi:MAG: sarcosine oxidase subunit alpha family protein [Hyphomicrobium sp.]
MSTVSQPNRIGGKGLIDRRKPLRFTFDGKTYTGFEGDTLASALLANGVTLTGRSFKYHRPRGILTAGSEEPNAIVELRTGARREPNTRATTAELFQGLTAQSQNRWPSLKYDVLSINSLLAPVFVAGFYYKTFMWPAALWEKLYEPIIRHAAGLGRAADEADPDTYDKATAFCDVLVVGAGAAGLTAALAAGRSGARVILADENPAFGGRLLCETDQLDGIDGAAWAAKAIGELKTLPEVTLMPRTTVFGAYDNGTFGAVERVSDHLAKPAAHQPRQRLWRIVAKRTIVATGATERPIVFGNNDLPGVMLASAVRTYINQYGVAPGKTAVVFTSNDDGARTVSDLRSAGVRIAALVDSRPEPSAYARKVAGDAGCKLVAGTVADALGRLSVQGARIIPHAGTPFDAACDLIAISGGFNPNLQLTTHLNGRPKWDEALAAFVPGDLPKGMIAVGAANGAFALSACLTSGAEGGAAAATDTGYTASVPALPATADTGYGIVPLWQVNGSKHKAFVDFQNDVAATDIVLAEREGYRSIEHVKRYTTLGMATDQGKTANVNGLAILAGLTGKSIPETGITSARPPYTPVALGVLAGHHRGKDFKPTRLPPSYDWAKEQGAVMVETGLWLRPQYFPRANETDWLETVTREVKTTRSAAGICDVSTLGKIEIQGDGAAAFLDRIYVNTFSSLAVGRARYGLMLREDGIVMDDGTTARFADDRYFMTTTTANAVKVMQHLEFCHQWHWPDLNVQMTSATDQWAQYSVAGPRARDILAKLVDAPFDISNAAFPYMAVGELTVCKGIKARLYRLSFSGELAYEIGVPARFGDALMRALMEAGRDFGAICYGTEALGVMRIEKGHVGGNEINGTTTATDLGLGKMCSTKKDYIGRILSQREGLTDQSRPGLVGIRPVDRAQRLRAGAHFLPKDAGAFASNDQGYVTSVAFSPMCGHWIGLGLLANGPKRLGEIVRAYDPVRNGDTLVEVVSPMFFDPEGDRLRV